MTDGDRVAAFLADKLDELTPLLRGSLHAGRLPFVVAVGVVLVLPAPTTAPAPRSRRCWSTERS